MQHSPLRVIERWPANAQDEFLHNLDMAMQIEPQPGPLQEDLLQNRTFFCVEAQRIARENNCSRQDATTLLLAAGLYIRNAEARMVEESYTSVEPNQPYPIANLSQEIWRRRQQLLEQWKSSGKLS